MKRNEAIDLNFALSCKDLKVKYLSGTSYASLLGLKRPLVRYLNEMGEDENSLAKEMDIEPIQGGFPTDDKSFMDKLSELHKKEFTPKELNFIPFDEFKKFTDEVDFNIGAILSGFILKS